MRTKSSVAMTLAAMTFLLVGNTAALADFIWIHESTEIYYDSGGTAVGCTQGCASFNVGDRSGNPTWKIVDQGWHDFDGDITGVANSTQVTYTVGNLLYSSNITSFHVPAPIQPVDIQSPSGWTGTWVNGFIEWQDGSGIAIGTTMNNFVAIYDEILPIVFLYPTSVDLANGDLLTSNDWVVSTVPVPGAVLLGALGLGMVGWIKRRLS